MHRVVVTGIGAITPYGIGVDLLRNGLLEGRSALKYNEVLKYVVGEVQGQDIKELYEKRLHREYSRSSMMALTTANETLSNAKAIDLNHDETMVNIGNCVPDVVYVGETAQLVDSQQERKVSPYFVPRILNNLPAGYVAMKYKMRGGVESTSTACATGLHCIGNSYRSIKHGYARRALAGGVECAVNPIALAGFNRMRALAKGDDVSISRPFDKDRSGFVLSEGSGLLFLERLDDAQARGAPILAEIVGYGTSSDCYHVSTPDPTGIGAILSMRRAIGEASGVEEMDIGYVNAHATSTPNGDSVEAKAIRDVFPNQNIDVSSIKGHIGHLLGAAGSVETIATIISMLDGVKPKNLNLKESEEDENLTILRDDKKWSEEKRISMCNSFGFGATNASLIVRRF